MGPAVLAVAFTKAHQQTLKLLAVMEQQERLALKQVDLTQLLENQIPYNRTHFSF